jgi:hypothetical protein
MVGQETIGCHGRSTEKNGVIAFWLQVGGLEEGGALISSFSNGSMMASCGEGASPVRSTWLVSWADDLTEARLGRQGLAGCPVCGRAHSGQRLEEAQRNKGTPQATCSKTGPGRSANALRCF